MTKIQAPIEALSLQTEGASIVWTIYCHTHTESNRCYIGMTKKTWKQRWNRHVFEALHVKDGYGHFHNAIRKYGKDAFSHEVLEKCYSLEVANLAEECWIELLCTRDPEFGFNLSRGGAHTPHPVKNPWDRPEFRAKAEINLQKMIAAGRTPEARAASKAACQTPESRTKVSAAALVSMNSPETIAKRQVFQQDPAYLNQIADSLRATLSDPQARARMSESSKSSATPEVVAKRSASIRAAYTNPDVKTRHSQAVSIAQNKPELLAKRRAYRATDATKAQLSAAAKGRKHTPEAIQKMKDAYWWRIFRAIMES